MPLVADRQHSRGFSIRSRIFDSGGRLVTGLLSHAAQKEGRDGTCHTFSPFFIRSPPHGGRGGSRPRAVHARAVVRWRVVAAGVDRACVSGLAADLTALKIRDPTPPPDEKSPIGL